jgi:hypothetical protein
MSLKKRSNSRRRRNPKHKSLRGGSKKRLPNHPKNLDAKILSIATFLRMYPHSKSQDQFYTILRKTKTFRCFYSFVDEVFGNMDEQLFSVLFLSFMISTSGKTSSFSFKDFIIRAVPTIVDNKTQIDEIDAVMVKFGNGLSKLVYEECVMAKRPSARTKMSASAAAGHRTRATHSRLRHLPFRGVGVGGKRNIRKTRTNKKYVQTGGDLLFIAELIMIFFEVIRRNTGYGGSISNWILPATLLLFFMLEISGQFSAIDYFGIGAGAPGGSAAVATAAAAAGNLPGFIALVPEVMQGLPAPDFPGGYESPASISPYLYTSAVHPQSTAAQRSAATSLITSQILFPQLSAISAIQIPELENAFELSPVREGVRLKWEDFLECLGLPNIEYVIKENASRIATLLRESQDVGMIPPNILDVHVDEIYTRLVEVFNQIDSTYNQVMGDAVVRIQCANPERRSPHIADRLFVQQRSDAAASATMEQEVFNGYVRLAATGGIVLSSATARNLIIRIFKLARSLFTTHPPPQPYEGWVHAARDPNLFGLGPREENNVNGRRGRAFSPQPPIGPDERLLNLDPTLGNMDTAVTAAEIAALEAMVNKMSLYPDYDEFGNPIGSNKP